jgi:hypothetical protein
MVPDWKDLLTAVNGLKRNSEHWVKREVPNNFSKRKMSHKITNRKEGKMKKKKDTNTLKFFNYNF